MPVSPGLGLSVPAGARFYRITSVAFRTRSAAHHTKVVNGEGAVRSRHGARYNYPGVRSVYLADTLLTCFAERMFYFYREVLSGLDGLHLLPVSVAPPFLQTFVLWDVVFRTAVANVFDLSVANAPAAGVFACLLMNPSQDYSHLKDRRAAIQAASYRGLQAPSTRSSTPGNMVALFDDQSKNVASITPYGVEFRLITPAGLPFASHATGQLDYLAGEVRVVTSPGASLPATIVGFSTWQRVDFNSVNNRLKGKGAKGFLPSSTLAVTFEQRTEAAGIAPEVAVSQDISEHSSCVNCPPPCLHTVCEDAALRELVANWHRLTPSVRTAILDQVAQLVTDSSALGVP